MQAYYTVCGKVVGAGERDGGLTVVKIIISYGKVAASQQGSKAKEQAVICG